MSRMLHLLIFFASVKDTVATQRRPSHASKAYRQELQNTGDAQYTGLIKVGGQELAAVVDTGSFELLVLSTNCSVCGNVSHLYNESASKLHTVTDLDSKHTFGSGTTESFEAFDSVEIAGTKVKKQMFWQVYNANMAVLAEDTHQAILGIGPPSSAIKYAQEDADEVHAELEDMTRSGSLISERAISVVKHYDELLTHAEKAKSVVQQIGLKDVSVCLGKKSLSPGYMIWNDHQTKNHPEKFTQVKVVGDYYWSAQMAHVKLGKAFGDQKEHVLGCKKGDCTAVIDTATTLIVAPSDAVDRMTNILENWLAHGGSCEDLSKLPDLHFTLDGHSFSLPPESYVGRVEGDLDPSVGKYLPHIYEAQQSKDKRWGSNCYGLLMKMDVDSQAGPLWILGLPLFRKYYTSFRFELSEGETPVAKKMFLSVANENCEPNGPVEAAAEGSGFFRTRARKAQLSLDASRIRVPRLVRRAAEKSNYGKLGTSLREINSRQPFVRV